MPTVSTPQSGLPAPDHDALATKLELMLREDRFNDGNNLHRFGEVMLADVRRLSAGRA